MIVSRIIKRILILLRIWTRIVNYYQKEVVKRFRRKSSLLFNRKHKLCEGRLALIQTSLSFIVRRTSGVSGCANSRRIRSPQNHLI